MPTRVTENSHVGEKERTLLERFFSNFRVKQMRTLRHPLLAPGTTRMGWETVSVCGYITSRIGSYYFVIRFEPCRPHAVSALTTNIPPTCPTVRNAANLFILVSRAITYPYFYCCFWKREKNGYFCFLFLFFMPGTRWLLPATVGRDDGLFFVCFSLISLMCVQSERNEIISC